MSTWVAIDIAIDLLPKCRNQRLLILAQRSDDGILVDLRSIPLWHVVDVTNPVSVN